MWPLYHYIKLQYWFIIQELLIYDLVANVETKSLVYILRQHVS